MALQLCIGTKGDVAPGDSYLMLEKRNISCVDTILNDGVLVLYNKAQSPAYADIYLARGIG